MVFVMFATVVSSIVSADVVDKAVEKKGDYILRDDHPKKIAWSETHLRKRLTLKKYTIRDDFLTYFSALSSVGSSSSSPLSSSSIPVWRQLKTDSENKPVNEFFSFYYPTPWSYDDKYVLQHKNRAFEVPPTALDSVEMRVVEFKGGENGEKHEKTKSTQTKDPLFLSLGCSFSWSFALGTRLQWLGTNDYSVIYNVRRLHPGWCPFVKASSLTGSTISQVENKAQSDHPCYFMNIFGSKINTMAQSGSSTAEEGKGSTTSLKTKDSVSFDLPFFASSKDGRYATSYNFVRVFALSNEGTYGYTSRESALVWELYGNPNNLIDNAGLQMNNMLIPATDGIWVIDVEKGKNIIAMAFSKDDSEQRFSKCNPEKDDDYKSVLLATDGTSYLDSPIQQNRRQIRKEYTKLVMTPRQVVDYLKKNNVKIQTGRQIGDWIENCFVWIEQPAISDYDGRITFFVRAKCPKQGEEGKGPWDLANAKGYQEVMSSKNDKEDDSTVQEESARGPKQSSLLKELSKHITHLQEMRYIDIGDFTVGLDGNDLWYAQGMPVSHFDFISKKKLLYCGNEGMAVIRDQTTTLSENVLSENEIKGDLYVSDMLATTQRADIYAGHCRFSRFDGGRFILTDTSCTACTVQCPREDSGIKGKLLASEGGSILGIGGSIMSNKASYYKDQCPSNASDARYVAILDTKTLELFRIGLLATDIDVPETLFVDLHPRFSNDGRFVMIDSRAGSIAKQYWMDVSKITWRDRDVSKQEKEEL